MYVFVFDLSIFIYQSMFIYVLNYTVSIDKMIIQLTMQYSINILFNLNPPPPLDLVQPPLSFTVVLNVYCY